MPSPEVRRSRRQVAGPYGRENKMVKLGLPHYDGAMEAVANFSFAEMEAIEDPAAKLEVWADAGTRLLGANEMPTPIYFRQKSLWAALRQR